MAPPAKFLLRLHGMAGQPLAEFLLLRGGAGPPPAEFLLLLYGGGLALPGLHRVAAAVIPVSAFLIAF